MKKFEWFIVETFFPYGWGNGYVKIPLSHWLSNLHYEDINILLNKEGKSVEYGLTFSAKEDNHWVVGFDTSHLGQTLKSHPKNKVKNMTSKLAKDLFELKKPDKTNTLKLNSKLNSKEHCEVCTFTKNKCKC